MMTATIATMTRIKHNHPVREAFADRSTGSERGAYYSTKGNAVNAFDAVLQGCDLSFSRTEVVDFNGDEGRATLSIVNEFELIVGHAQLTWHRMSSGRYEVIGYIG